MNRPEILNKILRRKRLRVNKSKAAADMQRLIDQAMACDSRDFASAFEKSQETNIISEIKRASPSKGLFSDSVDITEVAKTYEDAGACAVSVLTEEDFFLGSLDDLKEARSATRLPILRKDFIFDEFQIYEAAVSGADAVLLIAAMLDDDAMSRLFDLCGEVGLDTLVEVHDEEEMHRAANLGARLIGVNNRNLNTFEVDLETSIRLANMAPPDTVLIAESGISTRADIEKLSEFGFSGYLIGESLMTSEDPESKIRELRGV